MPALLSLSPCQVSAEHRPPCWDLPCCERAQQTWLTKETLCVISTYAKDKGRKENIEAPGHSSQTPTVRQHLETSTQLEARQPVRTHHRLLSGCQHDCFLHPVLGSTGPDKQELHPQFRARPPLQAFTALVLILQQQSCIPSSRAAPHGPLPISHITGSSSARTLQPAPRPKSPHPAANKMAGTLFLLTSLPNFFLF